MPKSGPFTAILSIELEKVHSIYLGLMYIQSMQFMPFVKYGNGMKVYALQYDETNQFCASILKATQRDMCGADEITGFISGTSRQRYAWSRLLEAVWAND